MQHQHVPIEELEIARVSKTDLKLLLVDMQVQCGETGRLHKILADKAQSITWQERRLVDTRALENDAILMAGVAALLQIQINHKDHFGEE